jgi:nitrate/nitrite transport system ATP-binding protein
VDEAVLLSDRIVMMTNGPEATIGEELHIELPRPRNRVTLANHPQYVAYRQSVLSFLYEKQTFPGKDSGDSKPESAEISGEEDSQETAEERRLRVIG